MCLLRSRGPSFQAQLHLPFHFLQKLHCLPFSPTFPPPGPGQGVLGPGRGAGGPGVLPGPTWSPDRPQSAPTYDAERRLGLLVRPFKIPCNHPILSSSQKASGKLWLVTARNNPHSRHFLVSLVRKKQGVQRQYPNVSLNLVTGVKHVTKGHQGNFGKLEDFFLQFTISAPGLSFCYLL